MIIDKFMESKSKEPFLNYAAVAVTKYIDAFNAYNQISKKKRIFELAKRTPEVMAVVRLVASDIIGNVYFEPLEVRDTGRNKVRAAKKFYEKNGMSKLIRNTIIDSLITGEGYNWLNVMNKDQAKEILSMMAKEYLKAGIQLKRDMYDEDYISMREIKYVASTTMMINFDRYNIVGYTQNVNGITQSYKPNEIIRYSFEELDGTVEGYSPLLSMALQLEILWMMWVNQFHLQSKGNHPDLVITVDGMDINHPSYLKLQQELNAYNRPGSPTHGNLVLSGGKYNVIQLDRANELQYKEVGQYVATLLANQWQVPLSRLGIKTSEAASSKDSGGYAEKGYWNFIEQYQNLYDEIINAQLFIPYFGVKLCHDKSYKHDDVVENTAQQLRLNNIETTMKLLNNKGKTLTEESLLAALNGREYEFTDEDLEESEIMFSATGNNRQGMLSDDQVQKGTLSETERSQKRESELRRENNTGKPSGV